MAKLIEREDGVVSASEDQQIVDLNAEDNPLAANPVAAEDLVEYTHEDVGSNADHPSEPEDDLPEKYKGKSLKEVIEMHQEAEKWAGRQSGELGDLRKTVDSLIQAQLAAPAAAAQPAEKEEEVDFFADPETAVERAIANHPKIKAAEEAAANVAHNAALMELERKHPDMGTLMASEEFGEWVTGSPFRTRLMQQAHTQYDTAAADELFSLYKETRKMVDDTVQAEQAQRKQEVKKASTGDTRGSGATPGKRLYKRHDIINLMQTNPAKYHAMQEEIMLAYAEGRVR